MPTIPGQLDQHGRALVNVRLQVPAPRALSLQAAGLQVPGPLTSPGLIDTGAGISCIAPLVRQALNLTPFGLRTIVTPSSGPNPPPARLYKVDLTSLHLTGNPVFHLTLAQVSTAQEDLAPLGIQVLIGRDVLSLCRFVYDGQGGTFELHY
jgi:hypothetical protein